MGCYRKVRKDATELRDQNRVEMTFTFLQCIYLIIYESVHT